MPRSTTLGRPRKSEEEVRSELMEAWQEWATSIGPHEDWRSGAAYIRESHKDSMQGYSPVTQLRHVLGDAAGRQVFIHREHVFIDNISGRHDRRPAFLDLMELARARRIAVIFVFHSSRFARNVALARRWKEELRGIGVEIIAGNLRDLDVSTPEGKLMETVQEAFDQYHSDSTGAWMVVSLRTKHEQGGLLGPLPETFYRARVGADAEGQDIYEFRPEPVLSPIVLEGARRYVARNRGGSRYGFGDLAKWSREQGHRTPAGRLLTDEWWRNALANPVNAGYVAYKRKQLRARGCSELRRAQVPGFIPIELYRHVQETRARNTASGGRPATNRTYLLTPMECGDCGGQVTAAGNGRYRCRVAADKSGRCSQPSVDADQLESTAGAWLIGALVITPAIEAEAGRIITARREQTVDGARVAQIKRRIERLGDRYEAEDPSLPRERYLERLGEFRAELARAERAGDERSTFDAMRYVRDLTQLYASTTPEKRRDLWRFLFARIVIKDKQLVRVRPNELLMPLFAATLQQRSRPDSNRRSRP